MPSHRHWQEISEHISLKRSLRNTMPRMHRTLSVSICLSQRPHIGHFPFLIRPTIAGPGHTEDSPTGRARSGATAYRGGAAGPLPARKRAGRRRTPRCWGPGSGAHLGVRCPPPWVLLRPRCPGPAQAPPLQRGRRRRVASACPRSRRRRHGDGRGWGGRHVPRGLSAGSVPRWRFGLN